MRHSRVVLGLRRACWIKLMTACATVAVMAAAIGMSVGPSTESAAHAAQQSAGNSCPPGYRTLYLTNNCSSDVWFAEQPASPAGGPPSCASDADCNASGNVRCVNPGGNSPQSGYKCYETCTTAAQCGYNQQCLPGGFGGSDTYVTGGGLAGECQFAFLEPSPASSPTPTSGSGWQLSANSGQAVICIQEPLKKGTGPTGGTGEAGSTCTKNTDCISNTCEVVGGANSGQLCVAGDTSCQCFVPITWGGGIWGRTNCTYSGGVLKCETGQCGKSSDSGNINCTNQAQPPLTLAEVTLQPAWTNTTDTYDISMVSGFNAGFSMAPVPGSFSSPSSTPTPAAYCASVGDCSNFNNLLTSAGCPAELQDVDATGKIVGCYTPNKACGASSPPDRSALGCNNTVPFLCQKDSDCPYGQQSPATQSMKCSISGGQAFGLCQCTTNTDCPGGYMCSGGACTPSAGTGGTWNDLYGCVGGSFFQYSPFNTNIYPSWLTKTSQETGMTCGSPPWSPTTNQGGDPVPHNINWEQVPGGSTGAVASPAATNSMQYYATFFHKACPTAYSYAYDDVAATAVCQNYGGNVGPSYDITFCPVPNASATATATPSPSPSVSPAPTSSSTAAPTPTVAPSSAPTPTTVPTQAPTSSAAPTATSSLVPTPVPGEPAGVIKAPTPVTVTAPGGQTVNAGSFNYTNTSLSTQQIGSVFIEATNPSALASLTLTVSGSSASGTVAPVVANNRVVFSPPVAIPASATVIFNIQVVTASGMASRAKPVIYAGLDAGDRNSPIAPLTGGLLLVGLVLGALPITRRRYAGVAALVLIALVVTAVGCGGNSSSSQPATGSSVVNGDGTLNSPVTLGNVTVTGSSGSATTAVQLTGVSFQ
jgi:hypothetical protein